MARPHANQPAASDAGPAGKQIRITQVRSGIGFRYNQTQILFGLGLSRPGRSVVREDTPSIRGMCTKIAHLVRVEPIEEGEGTR